MAIAGMASVANAQCGNCGAGGHEGKDEKPQRTAEMKEMGDSKMDAYFKVQDALASDDLKGAQQGAEKLASHLEGKEKHSDLAKAARGIADAESMDAAREGFHSLSKGFIKMAGKSEMASKMYVLNCPMAFGYKGAKWLQKDDTVRNPYFGKDMLTCGSAKKLAQK